MEEREEVIEEKIDPLKKQYKDTISHCSLENQLFCISKTVSKASIYNFKKRIQIIDSMKILNRSLDNATSMLTTKYQKVVQENMMQFLREENMVPSNFDRAQELSALLVKKPFFPIKISTIEIWIESMKRARRLNDLQTTC